MNLNGNITLFCGITKPKEPKWPIVHPREFWDVIKLIPKGYTYKIYGGKTPKIYACINDRCKLRWNGKAFVKI